MYRRIFNFAVIAAALVLGLGINSVWGMEHDSNHEQHEQHDSEHHHEASEKDKSKHDAHQVWTCSMCPEVKSDKPGKCPKCGMKLIPLKKDKKDAHTKK